MIIKFIDVFVYKYILNDVIIVVSFLIDFQYFVYFVVYLQLNLLMFECHYSNDHVQHLNYQFSFFHKQQYNLIHQYIKYLLTNNVFDMLDKLNKKKPELNDYFILKIKKNLCLL